jgi:hypothetical protein
MTRRRSRTDLVMMAALVLSACAHPKPEPFSIAPLMRSLGLLIRHRASAPVCPARERWPRDPAHPFHPCVYTDLRECLYASTCGSDDDCTEHANGHCSHYMVKGIRWDSCNYDQCYTDADCGGTAVCECSDFEHRCMRWSNCRVDADCGDRGWCAPSYDYRMNLQGYYCRTLADRCIDSSSCDGMPCAFDDRERVWSCARRDAR